MVGRSSVSPVTHVIMRHDTISICDCMASDSRATAEEQAVKARDNLPVRVKAQLLVHTTSV
jgi:hypothetical protein